MIAADRPDRRSAKLVSIDRNGRMRHLSRAERAFLFSPGDLVIANDAATLPASLRGTHCASGEPIEVRLAAWVTVRDPTRFVAIAFGAGDHRTRTEDRPLPPPLLPADRLSLGPLIAVIERPLDHPPACVMPAGDRDPMHLPVIPASACDAPDLQHFCHIFETLVIQNARPPARGYPAFCVLKMER